MTRRERSVDVSGADTSADVRPTRTRAERRERNKRAHAIRRELIQADYRDARERGETVAWRDIAAAYDAMPTDAVLETFGDREAPGVAPAAAGRRPAESRPTPNATVTDIRTGVGVRPRRQAPAHVAYARDLFRDARAARDALRESGETLPAHVAVKVPGAAGSAVSWSQLDAETFDRVYPAPVFKDILRQVCADMREQKATMLANA